MLLLMQLKLALNPQTLVVVEALIMMIIFPEDEVAVVVTLIVSYVVRMVTMKLSVSILTLL